MKKITITTWYDIEDGNEKRTIRETSQESGSPTVEFFNSHLEKTKKIEQKLLDEEIELEAKRLSSNQMPF